MAMKDKTTVMVSKETLGELRRLKEKYNFRNFDEVIRYLLSRDDEYRKIMLLRDAWSSRLSDEEVDRLREIVRRVRSGARWLTRSY